MKNGANLILITVYFSLLVQVLTGILSSNGIFIPVPLEDKIIKDALIIETVVQIIELIFYTHIAYSFNNIKTNDIVSQRYFDWVITTPIMLISTILYMEHNYAKKNNKLITTGEVFKKNKKILMKIVFYNFMMLLSGYIAEKNIIDKFTGIFVGFIFFYLEFYEIYINFAYKTNTNKYLFYFLSFIWCLYGLVAPLGIIVKNVSYNILDIIAKNFFGLFLWYELKQINNNN